MCKNDEQSNKEVVINRQTQAKVNQNIETELIDFFGIAVIWKSSLNGSVNW